jgi:hypothetical protein
MSNPKCKTCAYYRPFPIVKNEGECNDSTKIIYVQDTPQNEKPSVFDFSWCNNHDTKDA